LIFKADPGVVKSIVRKPRQFIENYRLKGSAEYANEQAGEENNAD